MRGGFFMKNKRCIAFILLVCMLMTCAAGCASQPQGPATDLEPVSVTQEVANDENTALFRKIFESETAYLAALQLENGAIPMTNSGDGTFTMNPYFADFAALALLDNADEYADEVKKYMDWHFAHLNTAETDYNGIDATIYDYKITVVGGKVTEEKINEAEDGRKIYDSTDSYAATFLSVLNKYYRKTGDKSYIVSHKEEIARIVNSMFATLHKGLAYARPDYEVKYLMDNCEVHEGALDAASLIRDVICPIDASYNEFVELCESNAAVIADAIETKLWKASENRYITAIFKNGKIAHTFSWSVFYPAGSAQVFPIIHGLIATDSERAISLYGRFCEAFDWQNFNIDSEFSWGSNVLAAAHMNDVERVVCYMENYAERFAEHKYPLYNADAARVCMAAYIMLERYS